MRLRSGFLVSLSALALSGCLYGFAGGGLPPSIKTVAVLPFDNQTPEPTLTQEISQAVREAVESRLGLRQSTEAKADAVVRGSITRYEPDLPVAYQGGDSSRVTVTQREVQITVSVEILDQKQGKAALAAQWPDRPRAPTSLAGRPTGGERPSTIWWSTSWKGRNHSGEPWPALRSALASIPELSFSLFLLAAMLVAAKLLGELAERFGQPAVLGELVAGVLLGGSVLGIVPADGPAAEIVHVLAELGVVLLLFEIGLETDLKEMFRVGTASLSVATVGVALPFAVRLSLLVLCAARGERRKRRPHHGCRLRGGDADGHLGWDHRPGALRPRPDAHPGSQDHHRGGRASTMSSAW